MRDHALVRRLRTGGQAEATQIGCIIEHGGFGASAAAPIVRDSMTYLFDQQKAFAALDPLEKQWGGTLAERNARQLAAFKTATSTGRMITSAIIPRPLARLPWRLIFLVTGIALFGLIVLYSAAGGSLQPWAIKQGVVFLFFLSVAIMMSWLPEATIKALIFPGYVVIVLMLIAVDVLGFAAKGAQRWLDLGPISLQPSEFMKPAIALTLARFYELLPAGRCPQLARRSGRRW